jgi:hypothetical protein
MEPKKSKKSTIQNIVFIVLIALLLFSPLGTFVKIQLNRLIAFSPKTIAVSDQKMLSSYQWQLKDATGKTVSLEEYKGKKYSLISGLPGVRLVLPKCQAFKNYMLITRTKWSFCL